MIKLSCSNCRKEYYVYPSDLRVKTCSRQCGALFATSKRIEARRVTFQPRAFRLLGLNNNRAAIVDIVDIDFLEGRLWYITSKGYATTTEQQGSVLGERLVHRLIMTRMVGRALFSHEEVDHKDGIPLNNRRSNLRIVTPKQNTWNSRPKTRQGRSSPYKGVSYYATRNKWHVAIRAADGNMTIGRFADEEEAALAYDAAAIQLYGDYAWLNFIGR